MRDQSNTAQLVAIARLGLTITGLLLFFYFTGLAWEQADSLEAVIGV